MNSVSMIHPHLKLVNVVCVTIECQHAHTHGHGQKNDPKSEVYCNLMPWGPRCFHALVWVWRGVGFGFGGGLVVTNPKSSQKSHQEMFLNFEILRPTFLGFFFL